MWLRISDANSLCDTEKNSFVLPTQLMPSGTDLDWLLQFLLAPFLSPGPVLSERQDPPVIHVLDITIVTMDNPVSYRE